jgi:hypothetical protein
MFSILGNSSGATFAKPQLNQFKAEPIQIREKKTDSNRQMTRVFTFEFQFEFRDMFRML